jgi:predicted transcriptional regulator/DNA-binding HxlR family transcriptional regulator
VNVVIDRLPKCLHTCLQCRHAVVFEEHSGPSKRIFFDGCWKDNDVRRLLKREDCKKFEESRERISRKFWEKWEWKVYRGQHLSDEVDEEEESSKSCEDLFKRADEVYAEQVDSQENEIPVGSDAITDSIQAADTAASPPEKTHGPTTRALVLQALTNNISRLKDIASFAGVDPSTAHYHMRNLMRDERAIKMAWGHYTLSDNSNGNSQIFLDNDGKSFEKLLRNFSQPGGGRRGPGNLDSVEKNILMDILSKDNKYEQFSERELARRNKVSRYMVKKYTEKLEKNKLITINQAGNQYVYTPTELAIKGLAGFFDSVKNGSKIDSSSSKIQPTDGADSSNVELSHEGQPADTEIPQTPTAYQQDIPADPDPDNTLETFDDYITWQQKNAHRLFIQFKLLQCNHGRLKNTGWIFGKKSIHKHFTEAYIFKSKDPSREVINVLPKDPFIFTSEIDFHTKIIDFTNEIIVRLRDYGIVLDLSEPAEIRMQHEAVEDDPFARKVIQRGLLYFRSTVKTIDSTGEVMEYVIGIDKSKKLHFEIEGTEAHMLTANLEAFVDDVISGRIDRKALREVPSRIESLRKELGNEISKIEERLNKSAKHIEDTQKLLHQNQLDLSKDLGSCMEMVRRIGEVSESVVDAAYIIRREMDAVLRNQEKTVVGMEIA